MSLIKWTPFLSPMLDDDFDRFLDAGFSQNFTPAVDVYQNKDQVIVEAPLAGIDPEKVEVTVENDVLTIAGSQEKKSEVDEKDYYRQEVRRGSFYRSIQLPAHVNGDQTEANYENGVLKIIVPKAEESKPKQIKINVKK